MKMEMDIDTDLYCAGSYYKDGMCTHALVTIPCNRVCALCHRKHPTPLQFKEEYGEDYPDDGAVYFTDGDGWNITAYEEISELNPSVFPNSFIVCACTPFGMPDDDWRPE